MSGAIPPLPNTPSWRGALLSTGTTLPLPGALSPGECDQGLKLTTHILPVPRLRMRGAIPPLPHTSSRRGAELSIRYLFVT
jgi:hypothetical protein